jgi:hypothetical protein
VAADDLALDRAGDVHREWEAIVLVRLGDPPVAADPDEVHPHVEVCGGEVGEAQRRRLMGDAEGIPEVLQGDVAVALGLLQEVHRLGAGHERRRREVVDLEALLKELGVVIGCLVAEHAVRDRLQRHRAQAVAAGDRGGRQVDATVREVGHRARRVREVGDVDEFETHPLGHEAHRPVGERPGGVADATQRLFDEVVDLGHMVVALAHPGP